MSRSAAIRSTTVPPATRLDLKGHQAARSLKGPFRSAFEYSDCWVDDARLVVLNAVDAKARGAHIDTRTRCVAAKRVDSYWRILLESAETGARRQVAARVLVNATGSCAAELLDKVLPEGAGVPVRLTKETHVITRRLCDHAYILRDTDNRFVFAVPFDHDFTLIGKKETEYRGGHGCAVPEEAEVDDLCRMASRYFREPVTREAIRFAHCSVRSLYNGASRTQETRDAALDLRGTDGTTPVLSVIGGEITTYRRLAEQALAKLAPFPRLGSSWTARAPLPGGAFAAGGLVSLVRALRAAYPFVSERHVERLASAYGTRAASILTGARRSEDLGRNFGYDLTEAEVTYLMAEEWAVAAGDVLWRRSRLGLRFGSAQVEALDEWMAGARRRSPPSVA